MNDKYPKSNPLVKLKNKIASENVDVPMNVWQEISDRSDIPLQTLLHIARLQPKDVPKMQVGTYFKLKTTLDIDMLSYLLEEDL